ncbi:MAG: hypothetical protein V1886_02300 [archaeon]
MTINSNHLGKLEAVLSSVFTAAGLGAGIYMTSALGNSAEDMVMKVAVIASSVGISFSISQLINYSIIKPCQGGYQNAKSN